MFSNLILLVVNLLLTVAISLLSPLIAPYLVLSEKRRPTLLAKLGLKNGLPPPRCQGAYRPIWVHALSVGETLAAIPLLKKLRKHYPAHPIYFSVSTRSGLETARCSLSNLVDAVFVSTFDFPVAIRLLTRKINPAAVILVESDVWPNFLQVMHNKKIPVFWVNARLSERSYQRFRRLGVLARLLFTRFKGICVQSSEDRDRLLALGIPAANITHTGNIKFDQAVASLTDADHPGLRTQLGLGPADRLLLAGSTHDGEEAIILNAWQNLRADHPNLRLVMAPRDPARSPSVAALCRTRGLEAVKWTLRTDDTIRRADVMIIDCLGLLKNLYAVAEIALVGGSLLDYETVGGHNPLEPAAYATPTVVGPNMKNFPEITRLLKADDALVQLASTASLQDTLAALLKDPASTRAIGHRAQEVLLLNRGAVEQTVQAIDACWINLRPDHPPQSHQPARRKVSLELARSPSLPFQH